MIHLKAVEEEIGTNAWATEKNCRMSFSNDVEKHIKRFDVKPLGFMTTKNNMAAGYIIVELTRYEKEEFGNGVFRLFSEKTFTTTVAKINIKKGVVTFIDSDAYAVVELKWLSPMKYDKIMVCDKYIDYFK